MRLPDGLTSRPATLADAEAVTELGNLCSLADFGYLASDVSETLNDWQSPYCNPTTNICLVFDGARLVGCVGAWIEPPCAAVSVWARVHPNYRGRGVGTYLAQWVEARCREAAPQQAPPNTRIALQQMAQVSDGARVALLEGQGYVPVRRIYRMLIDLDGPVPEPVLPEGVRMQAFDRASQMRALAAAEQDIFRDHWGFVKMDLDQDTAAWELWIDNDPHHDRSLWFLAMVDPAAAVDGIAGVCLCNGHVAEDPEMGYVQSLGVRRDWRHKGLGLALLRHAFRVFQERGKRRVTLDVDSQSLTGATRLYERAGMRLQRESVIYQLVLRDGEALATQTLDG